jgi:hypothetical protein
MDTRMPVRGSPSPATYRVESTKAIHGALWPSSAGSQMVLRDRALAVALAAKSEPETDADIVVVHIPSGEVIFRKMGTRSGQHVARP